MSKFKLKFTVDGKMTETVISANNIIDAKKIIEAQYPHSKIVWYNCSQIYN